LPTHEITTDVWIFELPESYRSPFPNLHHVVGIGLGGDPTTIAFQGRCVYVCGTSGVLRERQLLYFTAIIPRK